MSPKPALLLALCLALACGQAHGPLESVDAGASVDAGVAVDAGASVDAGVDGAVITRCDLELGTSFGEGCFCSGPLLAHAGALYRQSVGLEVYDLADPLSPALVTTVEERGGARGGLALSTDGRFLLSVTDFAGLNVYDIRDPLSPRLAGHLESMGMSMAVVSDTTGVVVVRGSGRMERFDLIDLSTPESPRLVGSVAIGAYEVWSLAAHGTRAFALARPTTPGARTELVELDVERRELHFHPAFDPEVIPVSLSLDGDLLYVGASDGSLRAFDVLEDGLRARGVLMVAGDPIGLAEVRDGRALLSTTSGLSVVDVRDPDAPRLVGRLEGAGGAHAVSLGDVAWLSSGSSAIAVMLGCL